MSQCAICLSSFKDPVCLPCGHIFCTLCLTNYVNNAPQNREMMAPCPYCRVYFHLTTPHLALLPHKYHPFVVPAVRRVFVENVNVSALEDRVEALENRLAQQTDIANTAVGRYEALKATVDARQLSEDEANYKIMEMEEDIQDMEDRYDAMQDQNETLERQLDQMRAMLEKERKEKNDLQDQLDHSRKASPPLRPSTYASMASRRVVQISDDSDDELYQEPFSVPFPYLKGRIAAKSDLCQPGLFLKQQASSSSSTNRPSSKRRLTREPSEMSLGALFERVVGGKRRRVESSSEPISAINDLD